MFSNYFKEIIKKPEKIILFNLDGILEIFLKLENPKQEILGKSIKKAVKQLDSESKRKLILLTPQTARIVFGF